MFSDSNSGGIVYTHVLMHIKMGFPPVEDTPSEWRRMALMTELICWPVIDVNYELAALSRVLPPRR